MKIDASYLLYLLDIFDGKLSAEEIRNMEIPLITELQKLQEEKLERQAKQIQANQNGEPQRPKYVNNKGEKYNK